MSDYLECDRDTRRALVAIAIVAFFWALAVAGVWKATSGPAVAPPQELLLPPPVPELGPGQKITPIERVTV